MKKLCKYCGIEFDAHRKDVQFCCRGHKDLYRYETHKTQEPVVEEKPITEERICPVCNKTFIALKRTTRKYCSDACRDANTKKKNSNRKYAYRHVCPTCGKAFDGSYNSVYCSFECRGKNWSEVRKERRHKTINKNIADREAIKSLSVSAKVINSTGALNEYTATEHAKRFSHHYKTDYGHLVKEG